MVRRYPVKAVKTGNWCLTVCQGVQTLSTDMFACDRHTPKYLLGKNLLPEKYLGSKYLSRSRFLRNIPRVRFWREIFPENIHRKTLLAAPKNILPVPPTKYLSKISTVRNSLRIRLTSTAFFFLPSPLLSSHYFSSTPCHPYSRNRSGLI